MSASCQNEYVESWLTAKITVEQAEADHVWDGQPFGHRNKSWKLLKAQMMENDEIWNFRSPPETWQQMAGIAGVALVRDGKVIESLITVCN